MSVAKQQPSPSASLCVDSGELPTVVYSAKSPLRHPVKLLQEILAELWRFRELTWILFIRDLKSQYRQSYLGYVWLFIPLVATTAIWLFLNSTRVIQVAATPIPYPAYVLLGVLIWGVFTASVKQPLEAFQAGQTVFMKLKVPPEVFILSGLGKIVFELLIRTLILIPVFLFLKITPASTACLFFVGMAGTIVTGVAIGYLLIPLGSLYTDVGRIVEVSLRLGMYLTPVVYPPPTAGLAGRLVSWNPLTAIVMTTRDWLTLGHSSYFSAFVVTTIVAVLVLFVGVIVFRVVLPNLIERMGM